MSLLSAYTHARTHAHRILYNFIWSNRAKVYQAKFATFMITHIGCIYLGLRTKPIQSRLSFRVNVHSILSVAPFFFFFFYPWEHRPSGREIVTFFPSLVSPANYFPSLERRNYVSPPFARAHTHTHTHEFSSNFPFSLNDRVYKSYDG